MRSLLIGRLLVVRSNYQTERIKMKPYSFLALTYDVDTYKMNIVSFFC